MRKTMLGLLAATIAIPVSVAAGPKPNNDANAGYYDRDGYYSGPTWRGNDGRMYCRRRDGTTGLIVGAAAGALVGRAIDRRGDRTTGTVVGGAVGALIGREVARSRCE